MSKNKLINVIMKGGNKRTCEGIFKKSLKELQKSTLKNHIELLKLSIVNTTPVFKLNQQVSKKSKTKLKRSTMVFIRNNLLRTASSLKYITEASAKKTNSSYFYQNFSQEILNASLSKGDSIERKVTLQKQAFLNKRYLTKFRW